MYRHNVQRLVYRNVYRHVHRHAYCAQYGHVYRRMRNLVGVWWEMSYRPCNYGLCSYGLYGYGSWLVGGRYCMGYMQAVCKGQTTPVDVSNSKKEGMRPSFAGGSLGLVRKVIGVDRRPQEVVSVLVHRHGL